MSTDVSVWRSRITRTGGIDPRELVANPANWRQHPHHQQEALRDLLGEVGWVQGVVVNERTGHLVDGHLRAELAVQDGADAIPVVWVDLTDAEERVVLASLDPVGALAVADPAALDALLSNLEVEGASLRGLLDDLAGQYADDDNLLGGDAAADEDFWPYLRLQVSRDTQRAFEQWWPEVHGATDDEKVRAVMDR